MNPEDPGAAMDAPSLIYIAGYGRSGSTLLDTLLSNIDGLASGGELCWLFSEHLAGRPCACGEAIPDCPFWSAVLKQLDFSVCDIREAARITVQAQRLSGRLYTESDERFRDVWSKVLDAMRTVSGAHAVVDSSKSTRLSLRRAELLEAAGERVAVIHLVRDPRSVMRSVGSGSNRTLERGGRAQIRGAVVRGLVGWTATNAWLDYFGSRQVQTFRVRYEDLVSRPVPELRRLAAALGVNAEGLIRRIEQGDEFSPGHGIAGNRMRRAGGIRLQAGKVESPGNLAPRWMPLVGNLMRRYGYD